ncbi:MAG TPA: amidohydrolase family protein, partial [Beijerinckiaceae bacterium]|nr:amidohydrolase family protein [Beijerinckiaceae bacterium]
MTAIPTIAPPHPAPRVPAFRLPPRTCDTHCHIFGPDRLYPYVPERPYTPPDAPLDMFAALHDHLGIERAVIVNATPHGRANRVVTDAIAQSGGRY